MLSGLRAHKASEERESYYLSDERLDFTQRQIDIANRNISTFLSIEQPHIPELSFIKPASQIRQRF